VDWTNLHSAAFNGDVKRVRKLLEKGENPNIKNKDGWTPLHVAAFWDRVDVVALLLERGADPTPKIKTARRRCTKRRLWAMSML